jgi:hypothetical protein
MNLDRLFLAAVGIALLAGPAHAQKVNVDFDKAADFSHIHTYAIKIGTAWGNPLGEKRVLDEITRDVSAKGWTKVDDEDKADAMVVIHGASKEKSDINSFYSGWTGYRYGWGGAGTMSVHEYHYTEGTLVVDMFDTKTKQAIWRGVAVDELSSKSEKNAKKLAKATDKMFKDFPPGSKKDAK